MQSQPVTIMYTTTWLYITEYQISAISPKKWTCESEIKRLAGKGAEYEESEKTHGNE